MCLLRLMVVLLCFSTFILSQQVFVKNAPSLDDLWKGNAYFKPWVSIPVASTGFLGVDAGTRVVVVNDTWYLFGRSDTAATIDCPQGRISANVRASYDQGRSWSSPTVVVEANASTSCMFADGSAFFDSSTRTWHFLTQMLGNGTWNLAHFSLRGNSPLNRDWLSDDRNPVVTGGQLFKEICAGPEKHCRPGMVDEGTPQIVSKSGADFYVTFHGYDYETHAAARGVARTPDFGTWYVTGGVETLPGDVIFTGADCTGWNVTWANGTCIGGGESSIIKAPSGYMYQLIEATDGVLTCNLKWNAQWWPLGLVRSKTWSPSPLWEQMVFSQTPFIGGPGGHEPHVGCSIQYNHLHVDQISGYTYLSFWDVSFHPLNSSSPRQTWHLYQLDWGNPQLPMMWPGPPQTRPTCETVNGCRESCSSTFEECSSDGWWYCCDQCNGTHTCFDNPKLSSCACGQPQCDTIDDCRSTCSNFVECDADGTYYCCDDPYCNGTHACGGLLHCACL